MPTYRLIEKSAGTGERIGKWMTLTVDETRSAPHRALCIYALYEGDELVYVGKTTAPNQRLATHRLTRPLVTRVKVRPVQNRFRIDYLERRLISRLKPRHNKAWA